MRTLVPSLRPLAVVTLVVVALTVTAPAPAHADALAAIGLASLAVVGVMIVAYLVVANVAERREGAAETGSRSDLQHGKVIDAIARHVVAQLAALRV